MPTIEIFPNEILIELFGYFTPDELYNSFFNLNIRFNSIISSLKNFYLILEEDWDNKQHRIPFYAAQVSTLIVKHDEPIDFSYYTNICTLKLCRPTMDQCSAILPYFMPTLKHLYISNFFFSDNSKELCRFIFSSSFSSLKTCHIDRMTLNSYNHYYSSSLSQLTISPDTWKSCMYEQILLACPNLVSLRIIRLQNLSFKLPLTSIGIHPSLRQLYVHFCLLTDDWFNHVDWLLSILPSIECLTLLIEQIIANLEFPIDLLAQLLMKHTPFLKKLKVTLPFIVVPFQELEKIKQLHPLFNNVQYRKTQHECSKNYLIISSRSQSNSS